MHFFLQLFIDGITLGLLYGVSAAGFVIIFRSSNVLNFAQGGLMAVGAFLFLTLSTWVKLPIIFSFALTLIVSVAIGLIIESTFLRPLMGKSAIRLIILALGLGAMLNGVFLFIFGETTYRYPDILPRGLTLNWGPIQFLPVHLATFITCGLCLIFLYLFYKHSSHGIYMRAMDDNQLVARSLGVNINRGFMLAWAIAALLGAISGIGLSILNGASVEGVNTSALNIFPVVILGGLTSLGGAIIGGVIIGLLESLAEGYIPSFQQVIPYLFLLIVLLTKPNGFFGLSRNSSRRLSENSNFFSNQGIFKK